MSGGFYAYDKTKSVIACVTIADFFYIIIRHSKMFIVAHEKADGLSILEVVPDLYQNLPAKKPAVFLLALIPESRSEKFFVLGIKASVYFLQQLSGVAFSR